MGPPTFLLLLLGGATTVLAADGREVYTLTTTGTLQATCTPGSWVDFELSVTGLENSNLMFEVEDKGDSYNPQALFVALWDGAVPSDRAAEQCDAPESTSLPRTPPFSADDERCGSCVWQLHRPRRGKILGGRVE